MMRHGMVMPRHRLPSRGVAQMTTPNQRARCPSRRWLRHARELVAASLRAAIAFLGGGERGHDPQWRRCGRSAIGECEAMALELSRGAALAGRATTEPRKGTREGLTAARSRGRTGGRKPKLNARQAATVRRMYQATGPDGKGHYTVAEIAEAVGVHRTTVYGYLRKSADNIRRSPRRARHARQVVRRCRGAQ
jgi:Helix-turn-helix domain of resolvase